MVASELASLSGCKVQPVVDHAPRVYEGYDWAVGWHHHGDETNQKPIFFPLAPERGKYFFPYGARVIYLGRVAECPYPEEAEKIGITERSIEKATIIVLEDGYNRAIYGGKAYALRYAVLVAHVSYRGETLIPRQFEAEPYGLDEPSAQTVIQSSCA